MKWDVIGVNEKTRKVRVIATDRDERAADTIVRFCDRNRQGGKADLYVSVTAGAFKSGDVFDASLERNSSPDKRGI